MVKKENPISQSLTIHNKIFFQKQKLKKSKSKSKSKINK